MFKDIFNEVKDYLEVHGGEEDDRGFTFRKRSDHIWRVFVWVQRLLEGCTDTINREALLVAALFHDIGYSKSLNDHANQGALLFREYAIDKGYDETRVEFIEYLIRNHSNKKLLASPKTAMELVLLLEADMLDETGALGIVWDAMMAGGKAAQNYMETYNLLLSHSCGKDLLEVNPMRTERAKEIWASKQNLIREFVKQLEYDLAINESR